MGRSWLVVREPLPGRVSAWLTLLAFVLPLAAWSAVSYVPFLWHPLVEISDPGDASVVGKYAYLSEGQLVVRIQEWSMQVEARILVTRLQPTKLKSCLACGAREPSMHTH
jgi:hypothetical protein